MNKIILGLLALTIGWLSASEASAIGRFRPRANANVSVSVQRGNNFVQRQVVRDRHGRDVVVEKVVVDNHHHHNNQVVQRVVVAKPVYQNVVVEKVVVDNHGHRQVVREVQRIRVR